MNNPLHDLPLVFAGPSPADAGATTLLLHGRGRTPAEMLALAERIALPEMSYAAVPAAGGSWYPQSFLAPVERNQPHLGWALGRIEAVVSELGARGLAEERIALLGFSQGACLAVEYVFRHPSRWGALIALTGGLIGPPGTAWERTGDVRRTPVLLATSDIDAWVPLERVKQTAEVFRAMGGAVDLRVYPGMEHIVNDDEIAAARDLLAPLVAGTRRSS
jgi:phospholipase/carboxylesterase